MNTIPWAVKRDQPSAKGSTWRSLQQWKRSWGRCHRHLGQPSSRCYTDVWHWQQWPGDWLTKQKAVENLAIAIHSRQRSGLLTVGGPHEWNGESMRMQMWRWRETIQRTPIEVSRMEHILWVEGGYWNTIVTIVGLLNVLICNVKNKNFWSCKCFLTFLPPFLMRFVASHIWIAEAQKIDNAHIKVIRRSVFQAKYLPYIPLFYVLHHSIPTSDS